MAHYRTSVRTPWSAARAYDYMKDLGRFDEWDPGIKQAVRVSGPVGERGSTYDLTVGGVGKDTVMRYEIVEADAPRRIEARSRTAVLESIDVITVVTDPASDGSIVTYDAELRLRGLLRLADPLLGLAFHRIGDRAAAGLREQLEGVDA